MTISISDLSPATSDSLVAAINEEEGGVIKSAVARALEARKVMGGVLLGYPNVQVYPLEKLGKITASAPVINIPGIIAVYSPDPPITFGLLFINDNTK